MQPVLHGTHVRLEPLARRHAAGLLAAAAGGAELFRWTSDPGRTGADGAYVDTRARRARGGLALPFATVRVERRGGARFDAFLPDRALAVAAGHRRARRARRLRDRLHLARRAGDTHRRQHRGEAPHAARTPSRTWGVQRVCFHTDVRNERSRNALLAHRGAVRGRAARAPPERRSEAARLGALFHPGDRVARREASACSSAWAPPPEAVARAFTWAVMMNGRRGASGTRTSASWRTSASGAGS